MQKEVIYCDSYDDFVEIMQLRSKKGESIENVIGIGPFVRSRGHANYRIVWDLIREQDFRSRND